MFVHIDDRDTRKRVVTYLREQGYLAAEEATGVLAHPLNSVSERYDRHVLNRLLAAWETDTGGVVGRVLTRRKLKHLGDAGE